MKKLFVMAAMVLSSVGAFARLSYEYSNLVFDARYNIGCTKVFKHSDEGYNNVIQITVGYKFAL